MTRGRRKYPPQTKSPASYGAEINAGLHFLWLLSGAIGILADSLQFLSCLDHDDPHLIARFASTSGRIKDAQHVRRVLAAPLKNVALRPAITTGVLKRTKHVRR